MKKYLALIFIFLSGCAGDEVHQSSFNVNKFTRVADVNGWYHFAGFYYKGQLIGGNPHGNGRCIEFSEHVGKEYRQKETACEFNNGERVDQQYVKKINDDNMGRSSSAAQSQREHNQQQAERAARAREDEKDRIQADRESYRKFQQDQHKFDAVVAQANRQIAETADRGVKQRQQQIQNDRAEQKDRAESDAAWAKLNQPRSTNTPSAPSRVRTPAYAANSNGNSSSGSGGEAKQSTAETRIIVIDVDERKCYSLQSTAESQNKARAKIDASEQCRGIGRGWVLGELIFAGHSVCDSCTRPAGEHTCSLTGVKFNCSHK